MSLWRLRLSMFGTLAVIIGVSTTFFAVVLAYFGSLNIISLVLLVALFNIIQWLFAPRLINALYKVKELKQADSPKLYAMVERLSAKSAIKKPKLGIANISIPNAFAYGSPISGNHVAVTRGLLETLEEEEVEAVLGHELGHLKHRDVQIMMLVSFLPSLLYLIGRSAMFSAYYGGGRRRGGSRVFLIGAASMLVYFALLLFTLGLSRLREYYADRHSASIIEDGARKLSEGLAKIVSKTWKMKTLQRKETFTSNSFKTLFISDPDRAESDAVRIAKSLTTSDQALVRRLIKKRVTSSDRVMEIFSTHPNIRKRLEALQALET